ncbi:MAG: hypothetical protein LBJ68_00475 [Endomicrobium sp.]|jgi:uncharacterized membrane protein required for colicin V production|nr:hypothetical protein [Endomicrobium sp.]
MSILVVALISWSIGFMKIFFTVFIGFLAIFIANKCSCQQSLNFYLVFVVICLFITMLCNFVLRFINFFYLSTLDRVLGVIVGVCVWLIVSINIIIPAVITKKDVLHVVQKHAVCKAFSNITQSKLFVFKNHVLQLFNSNNGKNYI